MESRRNGPQLSPRHDDDDDDTRLYELLKTLLLLLLLLRTDGRTDCLQSKVV